MILLLANQLPGILLSDSNNLITSESVLAQVDKVLSFSKMKYYHFEKFFKVQTFSIKYNKSLVKILKRIGPIETLGYTRYHI